MIGIVIVAHGGLAKEYLAAVEHVVGSQNGIQAITIENEHATIDATWQAASPIPITGASVMHRAASSPVSSKHAMTWAFAPARAPASISASRPGTDIASS